MYQDLIFLTILDESRYGAVGIAIDHEKTEESDFESR
jgi:hypothetical protein